MSVLSHGAFLQPCELRLFRQFRSIPDHPQRSYGRLLLHLNAMIYSMHGIFGSLLILWPLLCRVRLMNTLLTSRLLRSMRWSKLFSIRVWTVIMSLTSLVLSHLDCLALIQNQGLTITCMWVLYTKYTHMPVNATINCSVWRRSTEIWALLYILRPII